jgi:hypothetical protein
MEVGINVPQTGPEAPAQAPTNDRPAWLPENFKSPEDLAKSYKEAQAELTRLKQGTAPAATEDKPISQEQPKAPNSDLTIDQQAAQAVTNAGLDVEKLSSEFFAEGKLKDESYAALEKAGIPKAVVDDFIRLKQGEADSVRNEVVQIAGGQEGFQQMIQWAATNYADAAMYNQMISSGDPSQMRMAMTALKSAYVAANGQDPSLAMGGGAGVGGDFYANDLEMVADMQKPEYRNDPAFKRKVQEKVARSTNLFR